MKINISIYSLTLIFVFLIWGGCISRPPVQEETKKKTTPAEGSAGDADLLALPADREIVPEKFPVKADLNRGGEIIAHADNDTMSVLNDIVPIETDSLNSQAFRIQLFTSKVFGEARHAKQIAEEIFDRPVYLNYEVPYFKVRVGSFKNRDDAENYLPRVRAAGYKDAWVVMTMTSVKEAAPLYMNEPVPLQEDTTLNKYEPPEE